MNRREFLLGTGMLAATAGCRTIGVGTAGIDDNLSVFLADPHINNNPDDDIDRNWWAFVRSEFSKRIDAILSMRPRPRNVVIFGDLAFNHGELWSYTTAKELMKPIYDAGITVTIGMGNHDRRRTFFETFPEYRTSSPVPGRVVSIVDLGHADLVLLDSLKARDDEFKPGTGGPVEGSLDEPQQKWFKDFIMAAKRPTFVGAHHNLRELEVCGKTMLSLLRTAPMCMGWFNGHNHTWMKETKVGWSAPNQKTLRTLYLPSAGLWGDIGYVTFRTSPNEAVAELHQSGYWFNYELREGEKEPETWKAIVEENRGQYCRFPFEPPFRPAK